MHEIFDEYGVGAGAGLPLSEVEQAWRGTGLRLSDLNETLSDVQVSGEFAISDYPDGCIVILTERGFEHAQRDLSNLGEIDELIRAYATLSLVKRRKCYGFAFGRRRADQLDS